MANTASIYSLATEERSRAEAAAWARFANARDRSDFCVAWLAVLCSQLERVSGGVVLEGPDADGAYVPVAIWPDPSHDLTHLADVAQRALMERRPVVVGADGVSTPTRDQPAHIGYPVEVAGVLHGAVALDLPPSSDAALQRALRLLHWSSVWLVDRFRQQAIKEQDQTLAHHALTLDLLATVMEERGFSQAALALANDMAGRLNCERVSVGFDRSGDIKVEAISNTAVFDEKMSLVRLIGDAMEEAFDLGVTMAWPPRAAAAEDGAIAHAELARDSKDIAICSVPLLEDGQPIGIITLERSRGEAFDDATIELCEAAGTLLGPVLALKRENGRGTLVRLRETVLEKARILLGPRHPGAKLAALCVVGLVAFLTLATGTYRVAAKTVVEGAVQRAEVAPFDGHIAEAFVRAGDAVHAGQVLARLDDRELKLEYAQLTSEREQEERKRRQELAGQDRGEMMVAAAEVAQTDAKLALIGDKLDRATLTAPFDGVVVSGDLNQFLGTPVEQGKLLFQIAPLNAYRVILQVDERDISNLALGQMGQLTLSGLPGETLDFLVQQITPVASQQEGRNYFRVEAHLLSAPDRVRPGMEGIGKIGVGDRKLIWVWTHSLVDWFRFWLWKELP
jgi:RND family efflux transporter MFP subunit